MTANSYMKHVVDYKKKHPNISHIDAMKEASASYKPTVGKTVKKPAKERQSRERSTKKYTHLFGSLLFQLNSKKYDTNDLKQFEELSKQLKGKSESNRYARNLKKIIKMIQKAKPIIVIESPDTNAKTNVLKRQKEIEDASKSHELDDTKYDKIKLQLEKQGMSSRDIENYINLEKEKSKLIKADFEKNQHDAKNTNSKKLDSRIKKINASPYLSKREKMKLIEEAKEDMESTLIFPSITLSPVSKFSSKTSSSSPPKPPPKPLSPGLTKRLNIRLKKWELDTPENIKNSLLFDDLDALYINLKLTTLGKTQNELKEVRKLLIDIPGNDKLEKIRDVLYDYIENFDTIKKGIIAGYTAITKLAPGDFFDAFDPTTGQLAADQKDATGAVLLNAAGNPVGPKIKQATSTHRSAPGIRSPEEDIRYKFDTNGVRDFKLIMSKINKVKYANNNIIIKEKRIADIRLLIVKYKDERIILLNDLATTPAKLKRPIENKLTKTGTKIKDANTLITETEKEIKDTEAKQASDIAEIQTDKLDFGKKYGDPSKMMHSEYNKLMKLLINETDDILNKLPTKRMVVPVWPGIISRDPDVKITGHSGTLYDKLKELYYGDDYDKIHDDKVTDSKGNVFSYFVKKTADGKDDGKALNAISFAKNALVNGEYQQYDDDLYNAQIALGKSSEDAVKLATVVHPLTDPDKIMLAYFVQNNDPALVGGAGFGGSLVSRYQHKKNNRVAKNIDEEDRDYLTMAKMAYKKETDRSDVGEYKYEPHISNKGLAVYENDNNEICISFRGTREMEDVKSDLYVLIDRLRKSERYRRDYQITDHLIEHNKGSQFVLIGHSLGGSIALELHKLYPETKCVVFNAGISPGYYKHDGNTKAYTMKGDIISVLGSGKFRDTIMIDNDHNMINAHRLDSFK